MYNISINEAVHLMYAQYLPQGLGLLGFRSVVEHYDDALLPHNIAATQ